MRGATGRGAAVAAVLAATAGLVGGCGNLQASEVERAASEFAAADPTARCEQLAPATMAALVAEESAPCREAIGQVPLGAGEVVSVDVWGEEAQVRLTDDTLFLTRTDDGWRVAAGACEPTPEGPYDCQLEGS